MPQRTFLLFGYPKIELDGQPIDIKSRKGLAMLAYLAVTQQPQSRDTLATLLYPEYDQTRARTNLRRTLFNLNRTPVSDWLEADADTLALRADLLPCVDVVQFETELAKDSISALQKAVAYYRDDFLVGYNLPDSAPFDEWAASQRARLQRTVLQALERLTDAYLEKDGAQQAITTSRRQLEIDDLRERAWRQLMIALAANGQRNAALSAYTECCQTLRDELDVGPEEETTELWAAIRSGQSTNLATADIPELAQEPALPVPLPEDAHSKPVALALNPAGAAIMDNGHQPASPYRGLFAFREEDAPYFFGREEFTELLVTTVQEQSIVAVIGPSGSGKTSVVYAGLVAQLRQSPQWLITSFRPGARPFHALAAALVPLLDPEMGMTEQLVESGRLATALQRADLTLYDVVERGLQTHPDARRLLLIADQFEELYTLCADAELRRHFLDTLLELVFAEQYQPDPRFTLVLTLRADFLGHALTHRALADAIQEFDVKLGPMTRPELGRVIANPAQMQRVGFESGLVARILDDVGDEPGNLPLLEFSLASLWEQRANGQILHNVYEEIGRVDGALARYADQIFDMLDEDEQAMARRIFIQLVRPGEGTEDTRRIALRSELGDADWALSARLADARLVVTGRNTSGHETVEVVHEALIRSWGQLRSWMETDREFRVWQERLRAGIRQWEETDHDAGALLRGVPLAVAEGWLTNHQADLSRSETHFIEASLALRARRQQEQEAQRQRELESARKLAIERDTAVSRRLAIESAYALDRSNADLSLMLAIEAARVSETREAWTILRKALTHTRPLLFTLSVHPGWFSMAVWNADNSRILTSGGDESGGTASIWDAERGANLLTLAGGHRDGCSKAIWNRDESRILTSSYDGVTCIWDAMTGTKLLTLSGRLIGGWSPDGSRIFTASTDSGMGTVWDAQTGQELLSISGHGDAIERGGWNRDGTRIITNSADGTARVWDAGTGEQLLVIAGHTDGVIRARWNQKENRILTASIDGTAKLWDAASGEELLTFAGHSWYLWEVIWNRDESRILTWSGDGTARIWDTSTGEMLLILSGHTEVINQAAWNADESLIATASQDGTARIWDAHTGQQSLVFGVGLAPVNSVHWSANGSRILTTAGRGGARVWSSDGRRGPQFELPALEGSPSWYCEAIWNHDESLLVTASDDPAGYARVWETATGKVRLTLRGHIAEVYHVAWNHVGSRILTASADGSARVWDANTGEELMCLNSHSDEVRWADWNRDESLILTASPDGTVRIWDANSGTKLHTFSCPEKLKMALWNPDESAILTTSQEGIARVLDTAAGTERFALKHADDITWAVWHADGRNILTASVDATSHVWDATTGENILTLNHEDAITWAAWSQDTSRILTTSKDCTARVWDAATGTELLRLSGHESRVNHAAWNAEENRILTIGNDGTARIWDATTGQELMVIDDRRGLGRSSWSADGRRVLIPGEGGVRQYFTQLEDTIAVACQRLTRNMTRAEWQQYMGDEPYRATCPSLPIPDAT